LVLLTLLTVWFLRRESSQDRPEGRAAIDSLVVLPFVNSADNANVEYLERFHRASSAPWGTWLS